MGLLWNIWIERHFPLIGTHRYLTQITVQLIFRDIVIIYNGKNVGIIMEKFVNLKTIKGPTNYPVGSPEITVVPMINIDQLATKHVSL